MELVVKRIPKEMFEEVYKIQLPETYTASELLQIYSGHLGYVTGRGLPDENKAARITQYLARFLYPLWFRRK